MATVTWANVTWVQLNQPLLANQFYQEFTIQKRGRVSYSRIACTNAQCKVFIYLRYLTNISLTCDMSIRTQTCAVISFIDSYRSSVMDGTPERSILRTIPICGVMTTLQKQTQRLLCSVKAIWQVPPQSQLNFFQLMTRVDQGIHQSLVTSL